LVISIQGGGAVLIPDTDPSPDEWTAQEFGVVSDGSVTTAKLADLNVTTAKLANASVSALKMEATAIVEPINLGIAAAVAANALTVSLKSAAGTDASSTDPIKIPFRNATAATGTPSVVSVTGALSIVISSGSTLGHTSAANEYIYVYALNNAGTVELALSSSRYDDGSIVTTTVLAGSGNDDSRTSIYSTTAR
jgi:hypothetical protein